PNRALTRTQSHCGQSPGTAFVCASTRVHPSREPGAAQSVDTVATLRVARPACIPPGTYRFRVTAQNNDGVWNPAGATVDIVLEPHFYQRRLFYAACTAGLLFGS